MTSDIFFVRMFVCVCVRSEVPPRLLPDFVLFLSSHFTCPKIEELPIPPAQRKVLNVFRTNERAVTMASHRKRMAGCARAVKTNRPCIRPARPDIKFQYLDHMPRFTYAPNNINAFYSWIMDHRARFGLIDLFSFLLCFWSCSVILVCVRPCRVGWKKVCIHIDDRGPKR